MKDVIRFGVTPSLCDRANSENEEMTRVTIKVQMRRPRHTRNASVMSQQSERFSKNFFNLCESL